MGSVEGICSVRHTPLTPTLGDARGGRAASPLTGARHGIVVSGGGVSSIGAGAGLPAALAGEGVAANAGSHLAQQALPFTGIAFGLYVHVALGLFLTGVVLQLLGRRGSPVTPQTL